MTIKTQEQDVAYSAEVFEALQNAVRDLRRRIEDLTTQAQSIEDIDGKAVMQALKEIQGLIPQCAKAENNLHENRNRQAGIARGAYTLDLDKARFEIGCKLDRLRRCRPPKTVS
jgi:lipopolysaccharide biosynthesis regulator YciM